MQEPDEVACQTSCADKRIWSLILQQDRSTAEFMMITGSAVLSFRRAHTTVNPMQPSSASSLVTSGIYRYTRNPMYLGMLFVLVGWALYLANVLVFLFLPAFILYMNRFQIEPEERAMTALFGQEFLEYASRVRRWI